MQQKRLTEMIGEKIKSLRESEGLTQEEIAVKAGVSKEFISMVESGKRNPSLDVLSKIASVFSIETSYFMDTKREDFALALRTAEINEKDKDEIRKFKDFCEDYYFLENATGEILPSPTPIYPDPSSSILSDFDQTYLYAEKLALDERRRLSLGDEPIRDIFLLMETQGVRVVRMNMEESPVDGAFIYSSDKGAFMLINSSQSKGRHFFTAAHEYCHYLKDREKGYPVCQIITGGIEEHKKTIERIVNLFAANFLMPETAVSKLAGLYAKTRLEAEEVVYLKRYFGVSYQAMLYRLKDLRFIRRPKLQELLKTDPATVEIALFGFTVESMKDPERLPERYCKLAVQAYTQGKISFEKLAELLKVDSFELKERFSKGGFIK